MRHREGSEGHFPCFVPFALLLHVCRRRPIDDIEYLSEGGTIPSELLIVSEVNRQGIDALYKHDACPYNKYDGGNYSYIVVTL